jgi:hypothetical protein
MPAEALELLKLLGTEIAMMSPVFIAVFLAIQGIKCLLRSEMLRVYYNNKDKKTIRQFELENFIMLYKAYKALKGNSFIDKIYNEVMTWEVET